MKTSKLLGFIALLGVTALLSCSCVRSGVGVIISDDNTGSVEVSVGIDEKYYKMMTSQEGAEDIFEGKETSILKDGETSYICVTDKKEFKNLDELEKILLEADYDSTYLEGKTEPETEPETETETEPDNIWIGEDEDEKTEDTHIFKAAEITHNLSLFGSDYSFSVTTNPQELYTDDEMMSAELLGMASGDIFKLVVDVTMPGNIVSETGTVDGNTMRFTVTDFETETVLSATSSSTNIIGIVAVSAAVVLLVVILILVFTRKKPQNSEF